MRDSSRKPGGSLWLVSGALFVIAASINGFSDGLLDVVSYRFALIGTAVFAAAGLAMVLAAPGQQHGQSSRRKGALIGLGLSAVIGSVLVLLDTSAEKALFGEFPGFLMLVALPALIIAAAICLAAAFPAALSAEASAGSAPTASSVPTASSGSGDTAERGPRAAGASTWLLCAILYAAVLAVTVFGVFLEGILNNNVAFPASQILALLLMTAALTCALRARELSGCAQPWKLFTLFAVLSLPTLMSIFSLPITAYGGPGQFYDFTYLDVILWFIGALALFALIAVSVGAWRSRKA